MCRSCGNGASNRRPASHSVTAGDAQRHTIALSDSKDGRRGEPNADWSKLLADPEVTVPGASPGHLMNALPQFRWRLAAHAGAWARLGCQALGAVLLVGGLDVATMAFADACSFVGQTDVVELRCER